MNLVLSLYLDWRLCLHKSQRQQHKNKGLIKFIKNKNKDNKKNQPKNKGLKEFIETQRQRQQKIA